jgi:hypothetical protein
MRLLFLLLFLVFTANAAYTQTEVAGRVLDGYTGEYLPSATILIDETYRGTITNNEGFFSITVDELPVTLIVRYIGYNSERIEVTADSELPVTVELTPSVTELDEITVTEKDPGLSIMELVIERKKLWREHLESYRAEAYTRQILSNDTSIVSISESSSIAYWHHERGHREVQLSKKQTSNISEDQNFAGVSYMPNFYDDNVTIAGYNVVGITHPEALRYYHFKLLETQQMDGKPVYKIEVKPRRQRQPTFVGTAWVLGRDYALLEVDLKPNDVVSFPPPVQDFDLAYKQQFSNYGGDFWLPVDMRIDGLIRIGVVGLQFPSIKFSQVSRLSDYEINIAVPDSIYEKRDLFVQADSAVVAERTREVEPIPLTLEESTAYETIDSTRTFEEAFKPEGFLARRISVETDDSERSSGGFLNAGKYLPSGLGIRGHFNRMDGYHLGLNYQKRFNDIGLRVRGYSGYSFHSENWDYGLTFDQRMFRISQSPVHLFGGYENKSSARYNSRLYTTGMNSFATLLGGDDYFDYFRNKKLYGGLRLQRILPRTNLKLSFNRELHQSFGSDLEYDHSLFGWHNIRRPNPEINEGTLQSTKIELGYNVSSTDFGISGRRQILLTAEISDHSLGSDFDFTKLSFSIDWNFKTFYQRRLFTNTLDLHLSGGTALGELPVQRFGTVDGSMNRFTPFGTLKTRNYVPYEGNRYWMAVAEHNFRTIPFELLGLRPLVDRGWGLILFGGAGYSEADGDYPDNLLVSDRIHSEIGVSLNSIFGILRLDFAKRLDAPGTFIGFSVPRYF